MKRSEINRIIREAEDFLEEQRFFLPPWARFTPADWDRLAPESFAEIRRARLGWDVTDMGSGHFARRGLVLFTIRNGGRTPGDKPYAEKAMVVAENQETALHYHREKVEDIINRGGGRLILELYHSKSPRELEDRPVTVSIDGILRRFEAGEKVVLRPGESICLPQGIFHRFYAQEGYGPVLAGEVSAVNDDAADNYFYESLPRYPQIDEDEPPQRLLCTEYPGS